MRKGQLRVASILIIIGLLCLASGCAMTPAQRVLEGRRAYTAALSSLTTLRQAGIIDAQAAAKIEPDRQAAAQALDLMEAASTRPSDPASQQTFESAVVQFNSAMDRLIAWQATTRKGH